MFQSVRIYCLGPVWREKELMLGCRSDLYSSSLPNYIPTPYSSETLHTGTGQVEFRLSRPRKFMNSSSQIRDLES
jgi:hypothetical protein